MKTRFAGSVENCLESFLDCPHTVYVHSGWFRTKDARELRAVTRELDDGVEVEFLEEAGPLLVAYEFHELDELTLAYAVTVHKSQGSEYPAIVLPLVREHYMLLQRNLLYTAITRAKRLCILIGQQRALEVAVRNDRVALRNTGLAERLAMVAKVGIWD